MTSVEQIALAKKTFEMACRKFPDSLRGALAAVNGDPAMGTQESIKLVARLRALPILRMPPKFWSSESGFYEIGVGPYLQDYRFPFRCLGGIQFFQHARRSRVGKGNHILGVTEILQRLQKGLTTGFQLSTPDQEGRFHFEKRYSAADYPGEAFPCEAAAEDFCWLVVSTLPRFWEL